MDPNDRGDRKKYVLELASGDIAPPEELRGDAVSANGQCEWDKKKAFINRYKHGVTFEEASVAFEDSLAPGYGIIYDDPTDNGSGLDSFWSVDIRDKVIARLPGGACYMIKAGREHVNSRRVRLISVQRVSEKEVMKAIKEHEINSSVSVLARVAFASVGWSPSNRRNPLVRADINRRIQAYENIRYLSSIM
jgi:uncharacterized DUF497 family protein